MRKLITSIALLLTACLNVQCQKAEVHKNDGTVVEIPVDEIDSITFSMTNPFNFETRTVRLNSGYDMPIIGIGTFYLSTAQAEDYDIFDFELTPDEMKRINDLECNHRFASY